MNMTMKGFAGLAAVFGMTLAGCTGSDEASETAGNLVTFACPGGEMIEAVFPGDRGGEVSVVLPDQEALLLPPVEAASGAKYSDGTTTFWEQGGEAMVEVDGEVVLQNCTAE